METGDRPHRTVATETLQRAAHNVGDTVWALPSGIKDEKDKDYTKLQKRTVKRVNAAEATYALTSDGPDEEYDNEGTYGVLAGYSEPNPYQHGHRVELFRNNTVQRATLVCWHKNVWDQHEFKLLGDVEDYLCLLVRLDPDRSTILAAGTSLVVVDPDPDYNNIYPVVPTPDGRDEVRAAFRW